MIVHNNIVIILIIIFALFIFAGFWKKNLLKRLEELTHFASEIILTNIVCVCVCVFITKSSSKGQLIIHSSYICDRTRIHMVLF